MTNVLATFYTHSDKESSMELFTDAMPNATDEAIGHARGAGYEIEYNGYWTEEGEFIATHVNGTKLEKPTVL